MNRGVLLAALLLTPIVLLSGCREEEQNRPLSHQKGVYQGKPDTSLSDNAVETLRQRARVYMGADPEGSAGAGGPAQPSAADRPSGPGSFVEPEAGAIDKELRSRAGRQSF